MSSLFNSGNPEIQVDLGAIMKSGTLRALPTSSCSRQKVNMKSLFMNQSRLVFCVPIHWSRGLFLFPAFFPDCRSCHSRQCDVRCAIIPYFQLGEICGVEALQLNV